MSNSVFQGWRYLFCLYVAFSSSFVRAAVGPAVVPDLTVRREGDPGFSGENVYNSQGIGQSRVTEVEAGERTRYSLQVGNDGGTATAIEVGAAAPAPGWSMQCYAPVRALMFDGQDDAVNLGDWTPGARWTVEAWVKATEGRLGNRTIISSGSDCANWGITLRDGMFGALYKPESDCYNLVVANEPALLNQWQHVAATCDGATVRLYVDGELKGESEGVVEATPAATVWLGGEACCADNHFPGAIRNVRVWNRALAATELRRATVPMNDPGLIGSWRLDETGGPVAADSSSLMRHGTLTNGPAWMATLTAEERADVTSEVRASAGYSVTVHPQTSLELLIELTAPAVAPAGSTNLMMVTAASSLSTAQPDVVKLETYVLPPASRPRAGMFTVNRDFEHGIMTGLEDSSVSNQLQLSKESATLPFIWVPNSNEGTVSKVDTWTGKELGRYRTGPDASGDPSRTTVDQQGNCWVANRYSGTVVKIGLVENGGFIDRNGNGRSDTSSDANNDGNISEDEMLPWGQDECVLHEVVVISSQEGTYVPGSFPGTYAEDSHDPGPRGIAVDTQGNVWVGTYNSMTYYYVDGQTARILRTNHLEALGHTAYGAVIDARGILWSSGSDKQHVLRLNPADNSAEAIDIGHHVYGLGLDDRGHLFISGWEDGKFTCLNVTNSAIEWTVEAPLGARGVAVTADGDVWVAISDNNQVTRWSNDGKLKATIAVGYVPTGVAVDAAGKVWVVNYGDDLIQRIDPASNTVDLSKQLINTAHYGYSDMTGFLSRSVTTRVGTWTVRHNSGVTNARWGVVSWHADLATGSSIAVRVRSSNDQEQWSAWEQARNGSPLRATPAGKYVEFSVMLQADASGVSPVLYDLSIAPSGADAPALAFARGNSGTLVISWPQTPGWRLEATEQLQAGTIWSPVADPVINAGGKSYVTNTVLGPHRFFRVKQ